MAEGKTTPGAGTKRRNDTVGLWIGIGAGLGIALGALFEQIGLGVALGAGVGIVIGSVLASRGDGRRADRKGRDA